LSDAQADQLRALPRLQKVAVPLPTTDAMRPLLRRPHDVQWQQVSLPFSLDDEAVALLSHLPSLTKIDAIVICQHFDWLRGLPNLTDVILSFHGSVGAAGRSASLVAGLQHCSNIEILSLEECSDLTAAQLAELLPSLPLLRELKLMFLRIDSLSFLAHPPLSDRLVSFELLECRLLPLSDLRHVDSLRSLQSLIMRGSFDEAMTPHSLSLHTPPCALLPQLRSFVYDPPLSGLPGEEHVQGDHNAEDDDRGEAGW